jgi:hypothetical protein
MLVANYGESRWQHVLVHINTLLVVIVSTLVPRVVRPARHDTNNTSSSNH